MDMTITSLSPQFGARVDCVRLPDISEREWTLIKEAFHRYGVLIFLEQHLTASEQVEFGERFGSIEFLRPSEKHIPISNLTKSGEALQPNDKFYEGLRGNESWHIDSSNMPLAAKASILTAQVVPSFGGDTEFADLRDAYDNLNPVTKEKISHLHSYHSLYASQAKAGYEVRTGDAYGYHRLGMPVRPLVKTHPVTGRKSLYISEDAFRIPGLDDRDAADLLQTLLTFATEQTRTLVHKWRSGDVLVWDNRCVSHRARPYDYVQPRVMRHVRIAGDPKTELAETLPDEHTDMIGHYE